jgi:uncharacterized peroxidase-related enzyme
VAKHSEFFRAVSGSDATADTLRVDFREADLTPRERAICAYADKLTRTPNAMVREDVEQLRAVGLDDVGILHVCLVTSWFNYINRVADGLGLTLDQDTWAALTQRPPVPWEAESASTRPPDAGAPA